jgi:hypothetical protein
LNFRQIHIGAAQTQHSPQADPVAVAFRKFAFLVSELCLPSLAVENSVGSNLFKAMDAYHGGMNIHPFPRGPSYFAVRKKRYRWISTIPAVHVILQKVGEAPHSLAWININ